MANVQEKLLERVCDEEGTLTVRKVTIVGVGQVGMACAYSIMQQVMAVYLTCVNYERSPGAQNPE